MGPSAPLVTCHRDDTLHRCLELFAATDGRCERLICVDEHSRCTGIVSLSDIFSYLAGEGPLPGMRSAGGLGGVGAGAGGSRAVGDPSGGADLLEGGGSPMASLGLPMAGDERV
jgi:hypothetical protein